MTKIFIAGGAVAVFTAFVWTGTARANDATVREADAPSEVVQYPASQLSTTDGAKVVYDRIHTAAWRVCSDMFEAHTGPGALERLECINTLVDAAVKDVDSPRLAAVHEEESGYSAVG